MELNELKDFIMDYERFSTLHVSSDKAQEIFELFKDIDYSDANNALLFLSEDENTNWQDLYNILSIALESKKEQEAFQERQKKINANLNKIAKENNLYVNKDKKLDATKELKYSRISLKLLKPVVVSKKGSKLVFEESPTMKMLKARYTQESIDELVEDIKSGKHEERILELEFRRKIRLVIKEIIEDLSGGNFKSSECKLEKLKAFGRLQYKFLDDKEKQELTKNILELQSSIKEGLNLNNEAI